jgi:hypothetical protein
VKTGSRWQLETTAVAFLNHFANVSRFSGTSGFCGLGNSHA